MRSEAIWTWAKDPLPMDRRSEKRLLELAKQTSTAEKLIDSLRQEPAIEIGGVQVDFNESKWDLGACGESRGVSKAARAFSFRSHRFDGLVRIWVLFALTCRNDKVQTIVRDARHIDRFAEYVARTGKQSVSLFTKEEMERYIQKRLMTNKPESLSVECRAIKDFLRFHEAVVSSLVDNGVFEVIELHSSCNPKRNEGANQPIPDSYMAPLVSLCRKIARDRDTVPSDRVTACALLILSQTGMRICELTSLECGAIAVSKAPVEGEPDVPYIVFASPKGARGDGCWIEAKCIMNEIALEAYDTLTDICADRRAALKTNRLIVFPAQKKPDIDPGSFYMKYRKFFVDHREAIPCLNTQDLYPQLLSASAVCAAGLSKSEDAKRRFDRVYPDLDQKRDVIVYPGTHQFRSTLNSELRKRGVDWRFIQMNMSHLRADSPDSYVYDRQQTDEECSEAVYRMIFGGEARMLGRHADDFMAAVEEFLENRGINAAEHIDQMVEAAAGRFPLRAKAGGVCIRCGQVVPCSENEQTDELLCAFEACPNHCHFFFNIPRSYALAKERAEIARHNRLKGWKKAAENESLKLRNIVRDSLLPELKELEREISARGCDDVTKRHPSLASIVANIEEVRRETESWMEG